MQIGLEKRRAKRHHHKSFNGCIHCKLKRVKCDERKPACTRCLLSNVDCTYEVSKSRGFPSVRSLCDENMLLLQPCSAFSDPPEKRALLYYNEVLLPDVTGFTAQTETFWKSLIPRLSHTEPAIRHILIAVASKHEALLTLAPKLAELTPICAKHHSLALRCLSQQTQSPGTDIVLVSCIAFQFFERMRDPFAMEGALFDFVQAGLKILRERRVCSREIPTGDGSDLIDSFLQPMFFQIELMLSMFIQPDESLHAGQRRLQPALPEIPSIFQDTESAAREFFHIVARKYSLTSNGAEWSLSSAAFGEVRALLTQWVAAFDAYLATMTSSNTTNGNRAFYMREQACLLIHAILFSARCQVPLDCYCRPVSVDLATPLRISISIRIHDAVKVNLSGVNTGTPSKIRDPQFELWPHVRYVRWEGGDGLVVMEFRGQ